MTLGKQRAEIDEEMSAEDQRAYEQFIGMYDQSMRNLAEGEIVKGRVVTITNNSVVIDVGYKSEGLIPVAEFHNEEGKLTVAVGDDVEVLLEKTEDLEGHILLSYAKAARMRVWTDVENSFKEGRIIKGRVIDRIKGGLTVDVGVRAFLPGSLADIKPVKNLESLKGRDLEFKVISLDRRRNNIVLSRKAVLEKEYERKKGETLERLQEGERLKGVVKNITDYGVFVDLGGIDGLLHITDISWGRVNHPSEHFNVGDEVDVIVLKFDRESERVSLGYKQRQEDPWLLVDKKFPVGARVEGKVVSLVDYGAFVELEEGVEGLVHVSEMSWTKKVVSPAKLLVAGQTLSAVVTELDLAQRRISLSLRQTERNPWEGLANLFPVGSIIEGRVRNLTEFGAFVEITEEIDGLVHVSDMSWTKRIKHPSEVLKKGDTVRARITNIDVDRSARVAVDQGVPAQRMAGVRREQPGRRHRHRPRGQRHRLRPVHRHLRRSRGSRPHQRDRLRRRQARRPPSRGKWVRARILRIEQDEKKVGLTIRGVPQPSEEEIAELESSAAKRDRLRRSRGVGEWRAGPER